MIVSERKRCLSVLLRITCGLLLAAVAALLTTGCKKADAPPPALTLEELPPALEKVFAKPLPEATEPLNALRASLLETNYTRALESLHAVSALPGLNKEQANVVAAGLVTVNNALQEQQTQGDQNAAQALQAYRATK